jgi:hypothetical protein
VGSEMSEISAKAKNELDKLINIARNYRDNTISKSLFFDVIYPLNADEAQITTFKEYLADADIDFTSGDDDVEDIDEQVDSTIKIEPYNTANIDISHKSFTIDLIIARLRNKEIDLMPDFQRRSDLWSIQQRSQLIESLILRIPLPAFYFDGSNNDKWIVIDGLQRLSTLKSFFVDKSLMLSGLEFLHDLNSTTVDDMPRTYERRMLETQVTAYIINPGAPINLKYNIFKRINTGGLSLEPQEIRHALYQGYSTKYIKELAELPIFKKATGYSIKSDRMLDREFVLRFIAFYEQDLKHYLGSIESFLNSAMEIINKKYDPAVNACYADEVKETFIDVLELSEILFGKFAFRKMPDTNRRRPINKALFETWTACLAKLSSNERNSLKEKKEPLMAKYIYMNNDDFDFIESLRSAGTYSVKKRFGKIQALINEVLNDDQ